MYNKLYCLLILIPLFVSCQPNKAKGGNQDGQKTQTVSTKKANRAQLLSPNRDTLMKIGDMLPLRLSFSGDSPTAIEVSLNGAGRSPWSYEGGSGALETELGLVGDNTYSLYITYPDSAKEVLSIGFQLHSNIVPTKQRYRVINAYPHNEGSFTQGLFFHDGKMYEGSGVQGRSAIRSYDLNTGKVAQEVYIPPEYFGEGITLWEDVIYQLTYKAKKVLLYTADSFNKVGERPWNSEGWGLTTDGNSLIVSDGSYYLYFLDPRSLVEKRRIKVSDGNRFIEKLNELEYIEGRVYANVWETDSIVGIDPQTGSVETYLDLKGILPGYSADEQRSKVLNGIAYLPERENLVVTGKEWPQLFEIKITE